MSWQPGWYDDPWSPGNRRWWDGANWTQQTSAATPAGQRRRRVWPWVLAGGLALLLVAGVAVALVAIGGSDDEVATAPPRTNSTPTETEYEPPNSNRLPEVGLGEPVTLRDNDGQKVQVTVLNVVDPVPQGDYFEGPKRGTRWVGVQMRLRGEGPGTYTDTVSNGVRVVTAKGRYEADVAELDACPSIKSEVKLAQGATATGCVIVPVPRGEKPERVRFTASSGFAADQGTWRAR